MTKLEQLTAGARRIAGKGNHSRVRDLSADVMSASLHHLLSSLGDAMDEIEATERRLQPLGATTGKTMSENEAWEALATIFGSVQECNTGFAIINQLDPICDGVMKWLEENSTQVAVPARGNSVTSPAYRTTEDAEKTYRHTVWKTRDGLVLVFEQKHDDGVWVKDGEPMLIGNDVLLGSPVRAMIAYAQRDWTAELGRNVARNPLE